MCYKQKTVPKKQRKKEEKIDTQIKTTTNKQHKEKKDKTK